MLPVPNPIRFGYENQELKDKIDSIQRELTRWRREDTPDHNDDFDDEMDRLWTNKGRWLQRVCKLALYQAIANVAISNNYILTAEMWDYAERFVAAVDEGEVGSQSDQMTAEKNILETLYLFCKDSLSKSNTTFMKYHTATDIQKKYVYRSYLAAGTTKHARLLASYVEANRVYGDKWDMILKMGESEGYWVYKPKGDDTTKKAYIKLNGISNY